MIVIQLSGRYAGEVMDMPPHIAKPLLELGRVKLPDSESPAAEVETDPAPPAPAPRKRRGGFVKGGGREH